MTMKRITILLVLLAATPVFTATAQTPTPPRRYPFVNYTEVGGLFGRVVSGNAGAEVVQNRLSLTAQTLNGIEVSKRVAVGALVAVDWYQSALLMPVGAGLRVQLNRPATTRNVRVLATADAGYALNWLNKSSTGYAVRGGLMLNPGISLAIGKPGAGSFLLSLSYKRQTAEVEKPIRWNEIMRDESRVYNRLALRLGISF
jgi:hypothetical protein